ncbi:Transposable element Hobo transposase [Frankliniella fusca]|uniref:Transposable element Hobo transposase n=1 Tax=Frankliniella fusca TaxID=407009 RepID=A0AAE1LPB1_9NEOP|nr:Transposable element Hobo transposase [Frankliniella fusca]
MPPKHPKSKESVAKPQAQAPPAAPRRSTSRTRTVLTPGSAVTAPAPVRTPTPTPTPPTSSSTATVLLFSDQDAPFATPAAPSAVAVPVTPGLLSTTPPASSSTVVSLLSPPPAAAARRPPPLVSLTVIIPGSTDDASASSPSTSSPLSAPSTPAPSTSSSTSSSTTGRVHGRRPCTEKSGRSIEAQEAYDGLCMDPPRYILKDPKPEWFSPVWKVFKVIYDPSKKVDVGAAQCQRCYKVLKYDIKGSGISSLLKHVNSTSACTRPLSNDIVLVPKALKDNLVKRLAEKSARELSSIHTSVGEGMSNVVQAAIDIGTACPGARAADVMPCFNTVRKKLSDLADEERGVVVAEIKEAIADDRCSATTDMWTDEYKNFHYISVTTHFIDAKFKIKSWDLCTPRFPSNEKTTAENVRSALLRELAALGITEAEFLKMDWVTDQGANVVKALESVNRYDCMAHCINTALKTSLTLSFVELRKKLLQDRAEEAILKHFSEAVAAVKKARETASRKVGHGINLKKF